MVLHPKSVTTINKAMTIQKNLFIQSPPWKVFLPDNRRILKKALNKRALPLVI
jgi:hypothetical protein